MRSDRERLLDILEAIERINTVLRNLLKSIHDRLMFGSCFNERCRINPVLHALHRRHFPRNSR